MHIFRQELLDGMLRQFCKIRMPEFLWPLWLPFQNCGYLCFSWCPTTCTKLITLASAWVPVGLGQFQLVLTTLVLDFFKYRLMLRICVIMDRTITQGLFKHKHIIKILSAESRCQKYNIRSWRRAAPRSARRRRRPRSPCRRGPAADIV